MKQYLLLTSAFVAGGLLSGTAGAACIQTPTCSSLGYTSSSACTGGVKCPFGNAWNCTGPNNTTEINNIKNEITNIKNRIIKLENNSGSGSGSGTGTGGYSQACSGCQVGNVYYNGACQTVVTDIYNSYYVYKKEDGKCKAIAMTGSEDMSSTLSIKELVEINHIKEQVCTAYYNQGAKLMYYKYLQASCSNDGSCYISPASTFYQQCKISPNEGPLEHYNGKVDSDVLRTHLRVPKMITF